MLSVYVILVMRKAGGFAACKNDRHRSCSQQLVESCLQWPILLRQQVQQASQAQTPLVDQLTEDQVQVMLGELGS